MTVVVCLHFQQNRKQRGVSKSPGESSAGIKRDLFGKLLLLPSSVDTPRGLGGGGRAAVPSGFSHSTFI